MSPPVSADELEDKDIAALDEKASAFAVTFRDLCANNIMGLEHIRDQFSSEFPKIPPAQAATFLKGKEGDAWSIPSGKYAGKYVVTVALDSRRQVCSLIGISPNQQALEEKIFAYMYRNAPLPFESKRMEDKWAQTVPNGKGNTISFVWFIPDKERVKWVYTLTTVAAQGTDLQVTASAERLLSCQGVPASGPCAPGSKR